MLLLRPPDHESQDSHVPVTHVSQGLHRLLHIPSTQSSQAFGSHRLRQAPLAQRSHGPQVSRQPCGVHTWHTGSQNDWHDPD